jgi:predicted metal-dependent hydrolase
VGKQAIRSIYRPDPAVPPAHGSPAAPAGAGSRYWCDGDPFKTRFFEAMSVLAPEAERFFMACVRDYLPEVADPVLRAECREFIHEEAGHTRFHTRFNQRLLQQGLEIERAQRPLRRLNDWARRSLPKRLTLAFTAAGEHFAAIMSDTFLRNGQAAAMTDVRIREMYIHHALDEIRHRAVAYDLMQQVARVGYLTRVAAMLGLSMVAPFCVFGAINGLLDVPQPAARRRAWWRGLCWLLGIGEGGFRPGRLLANYFRYYLPGFHPSQVLG